MMPILIACAATLGIASASTNTTTTPLEAVPAIESTPSSTERAVDDAEDTGYECRYSPYCQKASQCTAYCAGGIPVCQSGCCACAS
jgi:hypothetical protein